MPWSVFRRDGEFCVRKDGTDETVGCHETREGALGQVRALYASEADRMVADAEDALYGEPEEFTETATIEDLPEEATDPVTEVMAHFEAAVRGLQVLAAPTPPPVEEEKVWTFSHKSRPLVAAAARTSLNAVYFSLCPQHDIALDALSGQNPSLEDFARLVTRSSPGQEISLLESASTVASSYFLEGSDAAPPAGYAIETKSQRVSECGCEIGTLIENKSVNVDETTISASGKNSQVDNLRNVVGTSIAVGGDSSPKKWIAFSLRKEDDALSASGNSSLIGGSNKKVEPLVSTIVTLTAGSGDGSVRDVTVPLGLSEMMSNFLNELPSISVLTAAAPDNVIPVRPPRSWFNHSVPERPGPITISSSGRYSGYLALRETAHIGIGGKRVTPPLEDDYRYFHLGTVETEEGEIVATGRITFDTGHADLSAGARPAAQHYDNTGSVGADVVAGVDEHGIWVEGALRPDLTAEEIRTLRAAPLSGDWRRIGTKLRLVAALAVNVPGFPIETEYALAASGEVEALIMSEPIVPDPGLSGELTNEQRKQALVNRQKKQALIEKMRGK